MKNFVAVICGLKSEAAAVRKALAGRNIRIGVSGADAKRAEDIARKFCDEGAAAIVSVGVSGGLDPSLAPGDLIIGDRVLTADGSAFSSSQLLPDDLVRAHLSGVKALRGSLFGADNIVADAAGKAELFARHGARAVDMESHGCARAAARAGVPFIAIRAVADPADRALPKAALGAVAPDGSTRIAATLGAALRDPKQFSALIKLGGDSNEALKTLRRDLSPLFDVLLARLFSGDL